MQRRQLVLVFGPLLQDAAGAPSSSPSHARAFDHAGPSDNGDSTPVRIDFRILKYVGILEINHFVAPWLAYMHSYRRLVAALTGNHARLGADVVR